MGLGTLRWRRVTVSREPAWVDWTGVVLLLLLVLLGVVVGVRIVLGFFGI